MQVGAVDFISKPFDPPTVSGLLRRHIEDLPAADVEKIMGANVRSNFWLCNMVAPQMAARKDGVIMIISSIGGLRASTVIGAFSGASMSRSISVLSMLDI